MKLLSVLFLTSLSAVAADQYSITGYSPFGYAEAKADWQSRANSWCPHQAVRTAQWALREVPRTVTRCSHGECDDVTIGTEYQASANFRCR